MNQIVKLAFRNIWRNKRRTLITAASILFAVFFSVSISSIQKGTWDHMIDSIVHYYFGYIQIHKEGFWEDKTIDNVFDPTEVLERGDRLPEVKQYVPRIESFALASSGNFTKGTLVVGTDPEKERHLTRLDTRVTKGGYLQSGDDGVLVAEGLAEYLKVGVGDSVILMGQGYHGINAAGKFLIKGLVRFGSPELNKQMIYLDLKTAMWLYGTEGQVTTIVIDPVHPQSLDGVVADLKNTIGDQYEVMDYKELMPELIQAKEVDTAGAYIILVILYIIIGFGIFGTILMMFKEREYEFGILKAIGMHSWSINMMMWLETLLLGLIGCLAGILLSFPLVYYFYVHPIHLGDQMAEAYEKFGVEPILPASIAPSIFISQALVVFFIISILAIYPMIKISRLKPIEAMRA